MRIRALLLTVFVIAGLALAACAPAPQPAAPAAEATATAAEATEAAAEATEATAEATEAAAEATEATEAAAPAEGGCTDPLGCVEIAAGDPIKIGYALVTAGPNSSLGEDSVRGIEIAVDDMGGEIMGHPIEIVGEDTRLQPRRWPGRCDQAGF